MFRTLSRRVVLGRSALALAVVVTLGIGVNDVGSYPQGSGGALPLGASLSAPDQANSGAGNHQVDGAASTSLTAPNRNQDRPGGAVPDRAAPLPAVDTGLAARAHLQPKVTQHSTLPAIEPKAVERPQDRTADTDTFQNPDGTRTLRVHSAPVNVRQPDGTWLPIDETLAPDHGRLRPKVSPVDVTFATAGADPSLVRLAFDGSHVLTYSLQGAAPVAGKISGAQVTYPGVRPAVDLRATATGTGVKEDLLLANAQAATSYAYTLNLTGLRPELGSDGSVQLLDGTKVIGTIPAGSVTDAGHASTSVHYGLEKTGATTWTLRVDLDGNWLHDPSRAFPVDVDPTATTYNADSDDTFVNSSSGGNHSGSVELDTGYVTGGLSRSYLHFSNALNALSNQYILGASLDLYAVYSTTCTPKSVTVYEATGAWSGGQGWPGAPVGRALSSHAFADGGPSCSAPGLESFPIDADVMTQWSHGSALGNGFSVRSSDESDHNGMRFASADAPLDPSRPNNTNRPYLDVHYAPEGAAYQVTDVLQPLANQPGSVTAKITNLGTSTWTPTNGFHFGYVIQPGDTVSNSYTVPNNVAPGQTVTMTIPIVQLNPGAYQVFLAMWNPSGQDFFVAYQVPYGVFDLNVSNAKPTVNFEQPANGDTIESLAPTLYAEGIDPDNWPAKGLTYKFILCTDQALTQGCVQSADRIGQTWSPPPGTLYWSKTYYWGVKSNDTVDYTPNWVGPLRLTTQVPQPEITSHLAGSPGTVEGPGLDPQIGNYSLADTDSTVSTVGPDLTIGRTYNSLDPRKNTAFGVGWSSRVDMKLAADNDNSGNLLLTYPSGKQVRFGLNPDGSFGSPEGDSTVLAHNSGGGLAFYTLKDSSGSQWQFDAALHLVAIVDPSGLTEQLAYDSNDHVSTITNTTSGRTLSLTWTGAHVTSVSTQAPKVGDTPLTWTYTYTGDQLTTACAPGNAPNCTTYTYQPGSHYRSSVADDNPAAYWRLDEHTNDTFVSTVARHPGGENAAGHGVIPGASGALGGTSDQAATFDGNSSYLALPDKLATSTMSMSAELWFKTTGSGTLMSLQDAAFPAGTPKQATPVLYVGTDGVLYGGFPMRDPGGPRQAASTQLVNDGKWHHAVISSAINTQTLYLDGTPVGTVKGLIDAKQQVTAVLGAGRGEGWPATNNSDFYFQGNIDEPAFYQHALGDLEVADHYAAAQASSELTSVTLPQDNTRVYATLTYDDINDRVSSLVDHNGLKWTMDVPTVNSTPHTDPKNPYTTWINPIRTAVLQGPQGYGDWTYTFDVANGGRLLTTLHNTHTTSLEYNTAGFLSASVDENNNRTEQTTDDRGNVLSRKTCRAANSCNTSYYTYFAPANPLDPKGNKLASSSDARSASSTDTTYRTTYDYDAAGRPTTTSQPIPVGQTTHPLSTNTYANGTQAAVDSGTVPVGLLVSTQGPRGEMTTYRYTRNGDLVEQVSPSLLHQTRTVDAIGRTLTSTTLNDGGTAFGTTKYGYDGRSQITSITAPPVTNPITGAVHDQVTTYGYDGDGNVISTGISDTLPAAQGGDAPRNTTFGYDAHDRLQSTTFPDNGLQTVAYSPDALTTTTTDVSGFKWATVTDEFGRPRATTVLGANVDPQDPSATSMTVKTQDYDPAGRLAISTDAMGRTQTYSYWGDNLPATVTAKNYNGSRDLLLDQRTYDAAGNLSQEIGAGGVTTTSNYDPAGYVASTTFDPATLKRTTSYQRDLAGNPTTVSATGAADPTRTEVTAYTYDMGEQVIREDDRLDPATLFSSSITRDERELPKITTDQRQLSTTYAYDSTGQLVSTTRPAADRWQTGTLTKAVVGTESLGRNAYGEVAQSKDTSGQVTTTGYDVMGRVVSGTLPAYTAPGSTQPIVATTKTEYDHAGNALKVTDPLNRITVNTYDPYGNVATTTAPQVGDTPTVTTYGYDRMGELASVTDPTGARQQFSYDTLGQQITETDSDRSSGTTLFYTTTTGYDDAGNAATVTTPQNYVTLNEYNAAGELTKTTDPTNRATLYSYDIAGRPATTTDPTGLVSSTTYDLLGRATQTAQSLSGKQLRSTTTGYDPDGNTTSTVSAEGRTVTYGYDGLNRLSSQLEKVDAGHTITTTTGYDALGNKSHFVDGNGHATEYTYNTWGLPESTVDPATAATPDLPSRTRTTTYDAAGQVATATAPGGVVQTSTFDAQGRLSKQTGSGAEASTSDKKLGYDLDGRVTTVGSDSGDTIYHYDDRGNLLSYTGPVTSGTYSYNGDGTLATRNDASGAATFTYDGAARLKTTADPVTGRTSDYGYNAAGQEASVTDRSVSQTTSRTLGYDSLGRLSSDQLGQIPDPGVPAVTRIGETYGYDLDDNLKTKSDLAPGKTSANSYGYDGADRLTSWTDPTSKVTTYGWDDAGNRTTAGAQTFSYNERNELMSGGGSTYTYTARGTLSGTTTGSTTTKSTFDAFEREATSGTAQYAYDSLDRVSTHNGAAFSYDGLTNNAVTDGSRVVSRAPDGTPLSDKAVGAATGKSLFSNEHGDVVGRYLGGSVDGQRTFDPFGSVTASNGDTSSLGYQGGWTDPSTNQVNMAARWYSPGTGQFTSRDSMNVAPSPSSAANRYAYGNSDPLDGTDPSGHKFSDCLEAGELGAEDGAAAGTFLEPGGGTASGALIGGGGAFTVCEAIDIGRDLCDIFCENDDPSYHIYNYDHDDQIPGRCMVRPGNSCTHPGTPGGPSNGPGAAPSNGTKGPSGKRPVTHRPPQPPPPPRWLININTPQHRPPPGTTVAPRPPQPKINPPANHVTDPGPQATTDATDVTNVGPNSQLYQQTEAALDDQLNGAEQLGGGAASTGCDPRVDIGPFLTGTRQASGIAARLCGTTQDLSQSGSKAGRKPRYAPPGYYDTPPGTVDAGHLLAAQFGGPGSDKNNPDRARRNLVTTTIAVNGTQMKKVEDKVASRLNSGETFYYQVTPIYGTGQRPDEIHMFAIGSNGTCIDAIIENVDQPGPAASGGRCV